MLESRAGIVRFLSLSRPPNSLSAKNYISYCELLLELDGMIIFPLSPLDTSPKVLQIIVLSTVFFSLLEQRKKKRLITWAINLTIVTSEQFVRAAKKLEDAKDEIKTVRNGSRKCSRDLINIGKEKEKTLCRHHQKIAELSQGSEESSHPSHSTVQHWSVT